MSYLQQKATRVLPLWWIAPLVLVLAASLALMIVSTAEAAIGYDKGVYNTQHSRWTTGNAGNQYKENDWVSYTYAITGITQQTQVPSFNVVWNHYQSNTNAVFVDAFASFFVCFDCPALTDTQTHPNQVQNDNRWVEWTPGPEHLNSAYISGNPGTCSSATAIGLTPKPEHCFAVNGQSLLTHLGEYAPNGVDLTGEHTIRIFYQAHLAATYMWNSSAIVDDLCTQIELDSPPPLGGTPSGCEVYKDQYAAAGFPYNGLGFASGSSRNFKLADRTAGPGGAITLPIPAVPQPAPDATLRIVKVTVGGDATFSFTGAGTGIDSAFSIITSGGSGGKNFEGIATGTKTITETVPTGWSLTGRGCVHTVGGATKTADTSTDNAISVTLAGGDDITCTFTNTKLGSITIAKNTVGGFGAFTFTSTALVPASPNEFTITTSEGNNPKSEAFNNLVPGTYIATETVPSGWALTNIACTGATSSSIEIGTDDKTQFEAGDTSVSIALAAGENVTCTFTNTAQATLRIVKTTVNNNAKFDFTGTGTGVDTTFDITTASGTGSKDFVDILPGTKTVTETHPLSSGWALTSVNCALTGGGAKTHTLSGANDETVSVNLLAGEDVTCTFANTFTGQPTIETTPWVYPNDSATINVPVAPSGARLVTFELYTSRVDGVCTNKVWDQTFTDGVNNVSIGVGDNTFDTTNNTYKVETSTTVYWKVIYSGDTNNNAVTSNCIESIQVILTPDPPPAE